MRVLFDTNIILDVINKRTPFLQDSYTALKLAYNFYTPCISTTTITDAVYISKKSFVDSEEQKRILSDFFSDFKICAVTKSQIKQTFKSTMSDFEDAVQAFCAKQHHIKYIVTRNIKDYKFSPVEAIEPADFLRLCGR